MKRTHLVTEAAVGALLEHFEEYRAISKKGEREGAMQQLAYQALVGWDLGGASAAAARVDAMGLVESYIQQLADGREKASLPPSCRSTAAPPATLKPSGNWPAPTPRSRGKASSATRSTQEVPQHCIVEPTSSWPRGRCCPRGARRRTRRPARALRRHREWRGADVTEDDNGCGRAPVVCFGRRAGMDDSGHDGTAEQAQPEANLDALLAELRATAARLHRGEDVRKAAARYERTPARGGANMDATVRKASPTREEARVNAEATMAKAMNLFHAGKLTALQMAELHAAHLRLEGLG